jgi:hypothetical protein
MSPFLTWQIFQTIVDCLSFVVTTYVLNKSYGYWFFNDALHSTISMNLNLKKK